MSHIRQRALAFMASQHTITLATVSTNGLVITTFPYVLADDFDFWVIADCNSTEGKALDSASAIAGMLRGEATANRDDIEVRVEGSIERVQDLSEQAKAFSGFLVRNAPLPKSTQRNGESGVLAVYRIRPLRAHVTDPSLLKHTAIFNFEKPPDAPRPTRAERRKLAALRNKKQAPVSGPAPLRDRPTLRDMHELANGESRQRPS